jgi:hypothetical protein
LVQEVATLRTIVETLTLYVLAIAASVAVAAALQGLGALVRCELGISVRSARRSGGAPLPKSVDGEFSTAARASTVLHK